MAPLFWMVSKPLHETGIAVLAGMSAADIRIGRIITHGKVGLAEYAFNVYFSNNRFHIIFSDKSGSSPSPEMQLLFEMGCILFG